MRVSAARARVKLLISTHMFGAMPARVEGIGVLDCAPQCTAKKKLTSKSCRVIASSRQTTYQSREKTSRGYRSGVVIHGAGTVPESRIGADSFLDVVLGGLDGIG